MRAFSFFCGFGFGFFGIFYTSAGVSVGRESIDSADGISIVVHMVVPEVKKPIAIIVDSRSPKIPVLTKSNKLSVIQTGTGRQYT